MVLKCHRFLYPWITKYCITVTRHFSKLNHAVSQGPALLSQDSWWERSAHSAPHARPCWASAHHWVLFISLHQLVLLRLQRDEDFLFLRKRLGTLSPSSFTPHPTPHPETSTCWPSILFSHAVLIQEDKHLSPWPLHWILDDLANDCPVFVYPPWKAGLFRSSFFFHLATFGWLSSSWPFKNRLSHQQVRPNPNWSYF